MGKIAEIIASGQAPGFDQKRKSERDPDRAVPNAFKSLSNRDVNKFVKESGFSVNHVKRVWEMGLAIALGLGLTLSTRAGDISKGYSFTATDRVTSTKLNNLVDAATINTTFFTGKASGTPAGADIFMFARSGTFYYVPFSGIVGSPLLVTSQIENTTPDTADYVMSYDYGGGTLQKSTMNSLVFTNAALIANRTNWPTPNVLTTYLLAFDSGTGEYSKLNRSNLFYNAFTFSTWTNLANQVAPNSTDTIPIWDSVNKTNKYTTYTALVTNAPILTSLGTGDYVQIVSNALPSLITLQNFSNAVLGAFRPVKFATSLKSIATSNIINEAHSLGATPQHVRAVLVCQTADASGYIPGDEVDINVVCQSASGGITWTWGANSTNVWLSLNTAANGIFNKTNPSGVVTFTTGNWRAKVYATYFP